MRAVNIFSSLINVAIIGLIFVGCTMSNEVKAAQVECLAMNIYHEARNESTEGQLAVAHVTMNRVNHEWFPDTICEVVYQDKQFSWTHLVKDQAPKNEKIYNQILKLSEEVYEGKYQDNTDGSTFYYADYIAKPYWAKQMEVYGQIDTHIFLKWDGTWD